MISLYNNKNITGYYIELIHTTRNIVSLYTTAYIFKSKEYIPILNIGFRMYIRDFYETIYLSLINLKHNELYLYNDKINRSYITLLLTENTLKYFESALITKFDYVSLTLIKKDNDWKISSSKEEDDIIHKHFLEDIRDTHFDRTEYAMYS